LCLLVGCPPLDLTAPFYRDFMDNARLSARLIAARRVARLPFLHALHSNDPLLTSSSMDLS